MHKKVLSQVFVIVEGKVSLGQGTHSFAGRQSVFLHESQLKSSGQLEHPATQAKMMNLKIQVNFIFTWTKIIF